MTLHLAKHYRLDWESEFRRLKPFLDGRGGVVCIEFYDEHAAPEKFSHLLKEAFGRPDNQMWFSLRIDPDWDTTHEPEWVLDELARLLAKAGFPVEEAASGPEYINILSGNDVGGDMQVGMDGVDFYIDARGRGSARRARLEAVCAAMARYVAAGGHIMIVVNDAPVAAQTRFWREIWRGGLADAGGDNLLLVHYIGPAAGHQPHQDSPEAEMSLVLPSSIESDERRQEEVYDDVFSIFESAGYGREAAAMAADTLLASNGRSVQELHSGLSKLILRRKTKSGPNAR